MHEKAKLLLSCNTKEEAYKKLTWLTDCRVGTGIKIPFSIISGQKVPYIEFQRVKKVVNKFGKLFGDFQLVLIHRDPVLIINSQMISFEREFRWCLNNFVKTYPKVVKFIEPYNPVHVKYSSLVDDPVRELSSIYEKLGQPVSEDLVRKITTTRGAWKHGKKIMEGLQRVPIATNTKFVLSEDQVKAVHNETKRISHGW